MYRKSRFDAVPGRQGQIRSGYGIQLRAFGGTDAETDPAGGIDFLSRFRFVICDIEEPEAGYEEDE